MSDASFVSRESASMPVRWWCEPEVFWLVLLFLFAFVFRLDALTLRGEESRRAVIAREIVETNDWIVPSAQGEAWFSRPPLQYWTIALSIYLLGDCNESSARLPSVLATLLTALLVYGYSRTFLSRLGAFSAAVAFLTMGQILKLGRLAETEAVFTFLLSASLLTWHWGYQQRWSDLRMWVTAYVFVALATLAKGSQAPVYFAGTVGVYLCLMCQWRRIFTVSHALGILTFCGVFGAWLMPYWQIMGFTGVRRILSEAASERFYYDDPVAVTKHLLLFPLEIWACMLPWSMLLVGYFRKPFRESIGSAKGAVYFLVTGFVVTFPTVWLAMGARGRYWMPMLPVMAPLIGLVIQRMVEAPTESPMRRWWTQYLWICSVCLLAFVGFLIFANNETMAKTLGVPLQQSWLIVAGLTVGVVALVGMTLYQRQQYAAMSAKVALMSLALAITLLHGVWYINVQVADSVDTASAVARVKQQIGDGKLVSLYRAYHLFAYYYDEPIEQLPWTDGNFHLPEGVDYFCFDANLPKFNVDCEWIEVARINCDRNQRREPHMVMVVARRVPPDYDKSKTTPVNNDSMASH